LTVLIVILPGTQKSVAFRLVEHQLQAEHGDVIPDARLQIQQRAPQSRILLLIEHALEQRHHHGREFMVGLAEWLVSVSATFIISSSAK
jgi:hypothetical protein